MRASLVSRRIAQGAILARRSIVTMRGDTVLLPDAERRIHLQFRRFAGCPVCNLHLRSVVLRHNDILAAGIREVVVFHSGQQELLLHAADLPFAVVADPHKQLYREFGVESSLRALVDPHAWLPILSGIAVSLVDMVRGRGRAPALNPPGGRLGLPADFLIASDGRVLAARYGAHASDQWTVDELLDIARHGLVAQAQSA